MFPTLAVCRGGSRHYRGADRPRALMYGHEKTKVRNKHCRFDRHRMYYPGIRDWFRHQVRRELWNAACRHRSFFNIGNTDKTLNLRTRPSSVFRLTIPVADNRNPPLNTLLCRRASQDVQRTCIRSDALKSDIPWQEPAAGRGDSPERLARSRSSPTASISC